MSRTYKNVRLKRHSFKIHKGYRNRRYNGEWVSAFIQPCGKWEKRKAARKVRACKNVSDCGFYKKLYGWMEWS